MKVTFSLFLLAILLVAVFADSSSSEERRPKKRGKNGRNQGRDNDNELSPFDREDGRVTHHHVHHFRPLGPPHRRPFGPGRGRPGHRRPPPHHRPLPPPRPGQQDEQPIDLEGGDNGPVVEGGRRPFTGINKDILVLVKPDGKLVQLPAKLLELLSLVPQKEQQQQQQQQQQEQQQQQLQPDIALDSNAQVSDINKIPDTDAVAGIDTDVNLTGQIGVSAGGLEASVSGTGELNSLI